MKLYHVVVQASHGQMCQVGGYINTTFIFKNLNSVENDDMVKMFKSTVTYSSEKK